ncbi:hypothetical protein BY996DRAFT_3817269 [Phakopsora pachyrhizi]|nr:hypothetical protein BY996DRAFT_3817269 [Phakopsora pachyrhizi]
MEPAEGLLPFRGEEVVGSPEKHRSHLAVTSQPQYEPEKFQNCSNTDKTHIGVAVLSSHFQPESEERKLSFERLRNKSELEEKRPVKSVDACLLNSNLSKADNGYLSEAQPTPGRSAEPCISVFTNKHTVSPLRSKSSDVEMRKEGSPTSFSDPIDHVCPLLLIEKDWRLAVLLNKKNCL